MQYALDHTLFAVQFTYSQLCFLFRHQSSLIRVKTHLFNIIGYVAKKGFLWGKLFLFSFQNAVHNLFETESYFFFVWNTLLHEDIFWKDPQ